jgi:hypothetical protein
MDHVSWRVGVVVAVAMILHALPRAWKARGREAFVGSPAIVQGLALAVAAILLHVAARAKPEPFVYGQF